MNVLHLLWDGNLGGVQRYVHGLVTAPYWEDVNHAVVFVSEGGRTMQSLQNDYPQIRTAELGLSRGWQLHRCHKLIQIVSRWDIQILHGHCDSPSISLFLPAFKRLGLVYTEHGDTLCRMDRAWVTRKIWKTAGRLWNPVIANSSYTKDRLTHWLPELGPRIKIVANPLLDKYTAPLQSSASKTSAVVSMVGRLSQEKGGKYFLEAAAEILRHHTNVVFKIFGAGPEKQALTQQAGQLGLAPACSFEGSTSDPLKEMAEADVILVPSQEEAFGLVALEALSVGTPVVAFKGTAVEEIIKDGVTGYLVKRNDVVAMATATLQLLENRALLQEMGQQAHFDVADRYGLDQHVKQLKEIYYAAIAGRPVKAA